MTKEELENYIPKGELKDFPKEIIVKMLDYQEEQGNPKDVSVFEEDVWAPTSIKGFDWDNTKDGFDFWEQVISLKRFDLFFEKYPKQDIHSECKYQESKTIKYVQVGDNTILPDITSTQSSVGIKINTTEEDNQEFRVGDKVYDILLKEVGVVQDITHSSNIHYGLSVKSKSGLKSYTTNGGYIHEYKNPHLLHYRDDYDYDVIDFNNLPKRQESKRWRAEKGEYYYYFIKKKEYDFNLDQIYKSMDYYNDFSNELYEIGNYFKTKEEAQEVADKLNTYFKQLIQKEHE